MRIPIMLALSLVAPWTYQAFAAPCVNPGGTGGCFATLAEAVAAAASEDTIGVAAGTYVGTTVIDRSLTIVGVGQGATVLDGGAAGSVIRTGPKLKVYLTDLTVQNGSGTAGDPANPSATQGGGIYGAGRLTLTNVTVVDNATTCFVCTRGGSGIYFEDKSGRLTLLNSTVTGNSGVFGAIHIRGGRLRLENVTVSFNDGDGGVMDVNAASPVRIEILGSTFSDNTGYFAPIDVAGTLKVVNSTVSDNTSSYCTGGINAGGKATLTFVTVANNTATFSCAGPGAGLNSQSAKIKGTILANNVGAYPSSTDCGGVIKSRGYNLIEDPSNCSRTGTVTKDITGVDPDLGPLANNGGPTETRALLSGSLALGAATSGCPKVDQRGVVRSRPCDTGAFEF